MISFLAWIIIIGIFFLFIIITGIWLRRKSAPYPTGLISLHKLLSLGTVVLMIITIYPVFKREGIYTLDWLFIIITAISIIAAYVTGALLARDNPPAKKFVKLLHTLSWLLNVLFGGIIIYRLLKVI